jgi:hypothetical protein
MLIKDRIYGNLHIEELIILELLKSRPMLRLKGISQFGVPDKYHYIKGFSRYEHSVGVMVLLRKLGATLEEQVAGLLHDISHTTFSHTIDWVLGDHKNENFQDDRHLILVNDPELREILIGNNLDPKRVFNLEKFRLLDAEIPDLCADRIDYAFRQLDLKTIQKCLKSLKVVDGRIVFSNKKTALLFAENFLVLQTKHWGGFESVSRWHALADILKIGLKTKTIRLTDFDEDDNFVMKKLESSANKTIRRRLELLSRKSLSGLPKSGEIEYKKFRYVDPEFISKGSLKRLSQTDPKFAGELTKARQINEMGIRLPLMKQLPL